MIDEMIQRLDTLLAAEQSRIPELRKEGKKVFGYFCCKAPVEIPHALGMIPLRIGRADQDILALGKEYVYQYTCAYLKCIVGEIMQENGFLRENVDVISASVSCISVHRSLEVLRVYTGKPVIYLTTPLNLPRGREADYYHGEMSAFVSQLEAICGAKLDFERLERSIRLYNRIRDLQRQLYQRRLAGGQSLSWAVVNRIVQAGFILAPERYSEFLEGLTQPHEASEPRRGARIMLVGSPVLPSDDLLVKTIEECGAQIVADTLCTGMRTFEDVWVEEPTLAGLERAYLFGHPCANMQCLDADKDTRLQHLLRIAREYKADGVIYYALRFCDSYAFKDDDTKTFLAEQAGLPMITIHSDYGGSDEGRLRTRVGGFIEMLQARARGAR